MTFFSLTSAISFRLPSPSLLHRCCNRRVQDSCSDSSDRSLDRRIQEEVIDELCWASVDEASISRCSGTPMGHLKQMEFTENFEVDFYGNQILNQSLKLVRFLMSLGVFWVWDRLRSSWFFFKMPSWSAWFHHRNDWTVDSVECFLSRLTLKLALRMVAHCRPTRLWGRCRKKNHETNRFFVFRRWFPEAKRRGMNHSGKCHL